jgi:histidine triad (HIT) family protein
VNNSIVTEKVYEDDLMIIIRDIAPQAKNHFLAIPKEHYPLLEVMTDKQAADLGKIFKQIPELKDVLQLDGGYRLVINQGVNAGQTMYHLHIHILCGEKLKVVFA